MNARLTTTLRTSGRLAAVALGLALIDGRGAVAGEFLSGSDGSSGAINCASGDCTVNVPEDGVIHATSVNVAQGATLYFRPNSRNTPIYLLAQEAVAIRGRIQISGGAGDSHARGGAGPGGFRGGPVGEPAGPGEGPGAGLGGTVCQSQPCTTMAGFAAFGCSPPTHAEVVANGRAYGNPTLLNLIGGSGGGGTVRIGGGGGGGALLVASSVGIEFGGGPDHIIARGGVGADGSDLAGSGSGGAVRLVAPYVTGNVAIDVQGGAYSSTWAAGSGRVRIDTFSTGLWTYVRPPCALSTGSIMQVFPDSLGTLAIIEAAGTTIPEGTTDPVLVQLSPGAPSTQAITIRARGYTGVVPIEVVVTPERGALARTSASIDMGAGDPADVTVNVEIPANQPVRIDAWTR